MKSPQPNISPPTPNGDVNKAAQANTQPIEIPKPRKAFVPPPPSQRPAHLVIPVQTADVPLPDANITGSATARAALPDGIGAPSFSKGAPPPPSAPPGPANQAGNGKVDIAVVGLHPTDKGQVPDGSRPGQFAQAPTVGEIATGEVKGGIGVPNLTIHDERKPLAPPHVDAPRKIVLYSDRLRSLPVSTLSVPLHPASRTIPARHRRKIPRPQRLHHGDSDRESAGVHHGLDYLVRRARFQTGRRRRSERARAHPLAQVRIGGTGAARREEGVARSTGGRHHQRGQAGGAHLAPESHSRATKAPCSEISNRGSSNLPRATERRWISTWFSRSPSAFRPRLRKAPHPRTLIRQVGRVPRSAAPRQK